MAHPLCIFVVVVVVVVVVSKQCIVTFNLQTESIEFASNSSIVIIPQLVVTAGLCPHNQPSSWLLAAILDVQVESIRSTNDEVVLGVCDI